MLVSTLNDADLTAWVRLGFLRGIAYPDVIPDEAFRLRLLGAFLSDEKTYPDAWIAALDAAIPRLIEADPFRTRMIAELASLLASQNRGAELRAPVAAASTTPLAAPTLDKIRALVETGASTDESPSAREQALRMAIAASPIGGEVPPLDALRARLEMVKLLGPLHRVPEAEKLVAQTTTEMQKAGVPTPEANWFLTQAAEHLAEFGSGPAAYFHDRGLQLIANAALDTLRDRLKAPGPFAPIYDAFSNAVGRQAKVSDKRMALGKLDEFVPQLATRLSKGKGPDDVYSFSRVYQRALLDAGQDGLAGIVAGQAGALEKEPDTYYVDFCKSMLAAGDTRFSAVASTCGGGKVVVGAPVPVTTDASAVDFDPATIDATIDALENNAAKEPGSRLEDVRAFMTGLTLGCVALTGAQPTKASGPPRDPLCVAASVRALGAALRMWRADHERRIDGGDAAGADLDTSLISSIVVDAFAQLGPALAEDLSSSGIEPLLDWLWSRRLPDDQATAQTLAQRILHPSHDANRSVLSQREWIRASAALHRALSIKADLAGINLTAASASEAWSRYAALAAPVAMPALPFPNLDFHLEALQAALPVDHGLVIFSTEPALAIVVRHDVVRLRMTQLDSRALAKDVSDYRRELQPSSEIDLPGVDLGLGYSLYRRLFGPVEADLAGVRRLILDLPTEFAPLPFAALVTDPSTETSWSTASTQTPPWLALRWETYVVAHPMLIPLAQGHRLRLRRPSLLLAGDPLLPEGVAMAKFSAQAILETRGPERAGLVRKMFERLPGAGAEIQGVAAQPGADHVETLTGAAFTIAALRKAISPQTTHFLLATHAVIGSNGQSFLVTTPTDADDGGVLSAVNILALPLNADLTVLSACRTGATANATSSFGEITTSLLMAGSKRVVTTLWPIVSKGAAEMTVPFFHQLLVDPDIDHAFALNAAARRLASGEGGASLRHPAFWAGYVLVGEP
jgi:CHAT domain-containing protein